MGKYDVDETTNTNAIANRVEILATEGKIPAGKYIAITDKGGGSYSDQATIVEVKAVTKPSYSAKVVG